VVSERHQRSTNEEERGKTAHIRPPHVFISVRKKMISVISVGKDVSTTVAAAAALAAGVAFIVVLRIGISSSNVLLELEQDGLALPTSLPVHHQGALAIVQNVIRRGKGDGGEAAITAAVGQK
jgi:hypothetical protein